MSKSDASDLSRINLTDDADTIAKKIRKAKTDPEPLPGDVDGLAGRPEADNLVGIYAALSDRSKADVIGEFGGQQFSAFKPALSELAVNVLSPISAEMRRLLDDSAYIDSVLADGGERASAIAQRTHERRQGDHRPSGMTRGACSARIRMAHSAPWFRSDCRGKRVIAASFL